MSWIYFTIFFFKQLGRRRKIIGRC